MSYIYIRLEVLKIDAEAVWKVFDDDGCGWTPDEEFEADDGITHSFCFSEVKSFCFSEGKYGSLGIEDELRDRGIPFSKYIDGDCEAPASEEHFRIDPEGVRKEIHLETGEDSSISKASIWKAIGDGGIGAVLALLAKHDTDYYVIPWYVQQAILVGLKLRKLQKEEA